VDYINGKTSFGDRVTDSAAPHLTSLQIELTSRCNERCVHCYIPHENKTIDMDPALFYNAIDQCRKMGVSDLTFSGGEPMMHPHFCEYLRKAKEYDFAINILSNLTMLNDEIVAEMRANRLSSVQVSLYSMKPEGHDSITQVSGSFYKTKEAILKLIENDIPLQISCPTMKQNKNDYVDVLNWAHEHKIRAETDYIMMVRYNHTIGNLDNRLNLEEVGGIINDIICNDKAYQEEMKYADIDAVEMRDISNDLVCGVCVSSICMVANGNVYPCAGWQDYVCGNVRETPLREIWENSQKVKYLRGLRKKDFPKCLNCSDKSFCAMCMVRNAIEKALTLKRTKQDVAALFWCVLAYTEQGLTVEAAMRNLPYRGFKIHPRSHAWDLSNTKTLNLAHAIFDYANLHELPVLIHTGVDSLDDPGKFSGYFGSYPKTRFILAHGRALAKTSEILKHFPNVYTDTAFMPEENLLSLSNSGFGKRILPGSDFPITHYFNHSKSNIQNTAVYLSGLKKQYKSDLSRMVDYGKIIDEYSQIKTKDGDWTL
jgi:radical SAM protein with 4Fe4S-binding SPASM domain